ncbi:MAG: hypothetical protein M9962_00660 [Oligoflexia bacterium]|nr:hypothetical protein [Oligoflexia bacterium]
MKVMVFWGLTLLISTSSYAGYKANYRVPVEQNLEAYSMYPIDHFKFSQRGQKVVIEYDLPETLAGEKNRARITGEIINGQMMAYTPMGEFRCFFHANNINMCKVHYSNRIRTSIEKVEAALVESGVSQEEIPFRLEVARTFGGDLQGELFFYQTR